jgi:hypothetical protein
VTHLETVPGNKVETATAKVWLNSHTSWNYSGKVDRLAEELKKLKCQEQEDGTATVKHTSKFPVVKLIERSGS